MEYSSDLYDEMQHLSYLETLVINFSASRLNLLRDLSTIDGFVINITMIATYVYVLDDEKAYRPMHHSWIFFLKNKKKYFKKKKTPHINNFTDYVTTVEIINILGYLQLVTSSLMMVFWFIINGPLIMKKQWRALVEQYKHENKDIEYDEEMDMDQNIDELSSQEATRLLMMYGPDAKIFNK